MFTKNMDKYVRPEDRTDCQNYLYAFIESLDNLIDDIDDEIAADLIINQSSGYTKSFYRGRFRNEVPSPFVYILFERTKFRIFTNGDMLTAYFEIPNQTYRYGEQYQKYFRRRLNKEKVLETKPTPVKVADLLAIIVAAERGLNYNISISTLIDHWVEGKSLTTALRDVKEIVFKRQPYLVEGMSV